MIDMTKTMSIIDSHSGKEYKVYIYTSRHAFERFMERGNGPQDDVKINSAIEKAARKIVNDFPDPDGEFLVKSPSTGLKFILKVDEPKDDEIRMTIPTMLSINMKANQERGIPNFTFEDFNLQLGRKTIII